MSKLTRKNLMLFAGGITGRFTFENLWNQEWARVLRGCLRTRCYFVDHRRIKKRYLRYYPDGAAEQQKNFEHALSLGYPRDNLFKMDHDESFILNQIKAKDIHAICVASYGKAIEESIIDAVNGDCFVIHPVRPLPVGAKRIPKIDRGASIIENAVLDGRSRTPFQIAMIRAEPVVDPADPADWDKGKILVQGEVFLGPEFDESEIGKGEDRLALRVIKTQAHIAAHYGPVLTKLPSVLGFRPDELVEAGVSKKRVIYTLGYTPKELLRAGLLSDLEKKVNGKKKKKK